MARAFEAASLLLLLLLLSLSRAADFDVASCGVTKTCLPSSDGCLADIASCPLIASVQKVAADTVQFELFSTDANAPHGYMAIGFKATDGDGESRMSNTAVTECSQVAGETQPTAKLSFNDGEPTNTRLENAAELALLAGLQLVAASASNGQAYCRITQKVRGLNVTAVPNADKILVADANSVFFPVVAAGKTKAAALTHHSSQFAPEAAIDIMADNPGSTSSSAAPTMSMNSTTTMKTTTMRHDLTTSASALPLCAGLATLLCARTICA